MKNPNSKIIHDDVSKNDAIPSDCNIDVTRATEINDVTINGNSDVTEAGNSDITTNGNNGEVDVTERDNRDVTRGYNNGVTERDDSETTINNLRYKWYNINWTMVPSKLAYFCEAGRRIGFAPNLALFLIAIGLNKEESGFIVGLG